MYPTIATSLLQDLDDDFVRGFFGTVLPWGHDADDDHGGRSADEEAAAACLAS